MTNLGLCNEAKVRGRGAGCWMASLHDFKHDDKPIDSALPSSIQTSMSSGVKVVISGTMMTTPAACFWSISVCRSSTETSCAVTSTTRFATLCADATATSPLKTDRREPVSQHQVRAKRWQGCAKDCSRRHEANLSSVCGTAPSPRIELEPPGQMHQTHCEMNFQTKMP